MKHRQIWLMALIYTGALSVGTTLSIRSPQLPKSFHLDDLIAGLLDVIPYGLVSMLVIVRGRSSGRNNERRWHTAFTLFMIATDVFATFINLLFPATIMILSIILVDAYTAKGPFWVLASGWTSSTSATVGLATIDAIANPTGGAVMVNAYGIISERIGSHMLAMLPLAALYLAGDITVLTMGWRYSQTARQKKQMAY